MVELDADLDNAERPTVSIQNGLPICFLHLLRERLIHQREERLRPRRRHFVDRQKVDHQAELLLRDAAELPVVGVLRIPLVDLDQGRDVLTPPPAESRCVTRFQCRSMNMKATTDCSTTIGTMMISSARA